MSELNDPATVLQDLVLAERDALKRVSEAEGEAEAAVLARSEAEQRAEELAAEGQDRASKAARAAAEAERAAADRSAAERDAASLAAEAHRLRRLIEANELFARRNGSATTSSEGESTESLRSKMDTALASREAAVRKAAEFATTERSAAQRAAAERAAVARLTAARAQAARIAAEQAQVELNARERASTALEEAGRLSAQRRAAEQALEAAQLSSPLDLDAPVESSAQASAAETTAAADTWNPEDELQPSAHENPALATGDVSVGGDASDALTSEIGQPEPIGSRPSPVATSPTAPAASTAVSESPLAHGLDAETRLLPNSAARQLRSARSSERERARSQKERSSNAERVRIQLGRESGTPAARETRPPRPTARFETNERETAQNLDSSSVTRRIPDRPPLDEAAAATSDISRARNALAQECADRLATTAARARNLLEVPEGSSPKRWLFAAVPALALVFGGLFLGRWMTALPDASKGRPTAAAPRVGPPAATTTPNAAAPAASGTALVSTGLTPPSTGNTRPEGERGLENRDGETDRRPTWLRNAAASPSFDGRPIIAIVIDDMGMDEAISAQVMNLPSPLTISFLPASPRLARQVEVARAAGHEVLAHVPMEPTGDGNDPGPNFLGVGQTEAELRARIAWNLNQLHGIVGINNHMGSLFTRNATGMRIVMQELRRREMLFLDSRTTGSSLGARSAAEEGLPYTSRDVFLDNDRDPKLIWQQIAQVEEIAKRRGSAVCIGHPLRATVDTLAKWLPRARERGIQFVPITAVVKAQMANRTASVR